VSHDSQTQHTCNVDTSLSSWVVSDADTTRRPRALSHGSHTHSLYASYTIDELNLGSHTLAHSIRHTLFTNDWVRGLCTTHRVCWAIAHTLTHSMRHTLFTNDWVRESCTMHWVHWAMAHTLHKLKASYTIHELNESSTIHELNRSYNSRTQWDALSALSLDSPHHTFAKVRHDLLWLCYSLSCMCMCKCMCIHMSAWRIARTQSGLKKKNPPLNFTNSMIVWRCPHTQSSPKVLFAPSKIQRCHLQRWIFPGINLDLNYHCGHHVGLLLRLLCVCVCVWVCGCGCVCACVYRWKRRQKRPRQRWIGLRWVCIHILCICKNMYVCMYVCM